MTAPRAPRLDTMAGDLRYALRQGRRTPLATLTLLLVLSLGIGVNTGVFTLLTSLATLPPTGMPRDRELVRIRGWAHAGRAEAIQPRLLSWPEVEEYARRADLFTDVAAHAEETGLVSGLEFSSPPVTTRLIYTTANYFRLLEVRPALGTPPHPEPEVRRLAAPPTAVISHTLWRRLGGTPEVIGRVVQVNGTSVTIVGVTPPRFAGTGGDGPVTIWVPLAAYPLLQQRSAALFSSPDSLFLHAAARLAPGVMVEAATSVVAAVAGRFTRKGTGATHLLAAGADLAPMLASNEQIGNRSDQLISATAAAALALVVLLITGTNVSALMIGLAVARRREMAVRLSLGAPRARLVRQLLTESVLLAVVAGGLGLLVTAAAIQVAGRLVADLPLAVDWRVTIASLGVAVGTGILCGLSPALHATRIPVNEVLRSASSAIGAPPSRAQQALVVGQVALTQPLLVGLGVVVASMTAELRQLTAVTVADQIVEVELDPWAGRVTGTDREQRIAGLVERIAAMPGVRTAVPMQMGTVVAPLAVHPADRVDRPAAGMVMQASMTAAPRGYFAAHSIPIVRGRDFAGTEQVHASRDGEPPSFDVAIIGSDLAERLWGSADPVGRRLVMGVPERAGSPGMEVVGVVAAAAAGPSDVNGLVRVYVPYAAMNTGVIARTAGPALPLLDEIRRAAASQVPDVPIQRAETMAQRQAEVRANVRRAGAGVAGGGGLALWLSALGLYAVISFSVAQRTREIGIRSALGAQPGQIIRMFIGRGLALGVAGLLLGLPLSLVAVRLITSALHWPVAALPALCIAVAGLVLAVVGAAAWVPARRAGRVDPLTALREE